ncbi:MAG: mismatch-specific DNA-glycosylase [Nitrospirota bacterium]|nr:MAG: mismatch-specific DNA-glycosylase [Nitrospirota bacterium]
MTKLPDYINSEVKVLFVGINPGIRSASVGHHFAGFSNRFWKLLSDSKLVPEPLIYHDDWRLTEWGIGLTNIVSRPTSGSNALTPKDYQIGRAQLAVKIRKYRISIIALLGITLCPILFPRTSRGGAQSEQKPLKPQLGFQPETFAGARVFLVPNPSGRNAHYSYADMLNHFKKLTKFVRTGEDKTNKAKFS